MYLVAIYGGDGFGEPEHRVISTPLLHYVPYQVFLAVIGR